MNLKQNRKRSYMCWSKNGLQVPIVMHNESKEAKAWNQIYSEETKKQSIPVITAWQLNERMYVIFYAWLHLPFPLHLTLKTLSQIELPAVFSLPLSLFFCIGMGNYRVLISRRQLKDMERKKCMSGVEVLIFLPLMVRVWKCVHRELLLTLENM